MKFVDKKTGQFILTSIALFILGSLLPHFRPGILASGRVEKKIDNKNTIL